MRHLHLSCLWQIFGMLLGLKRLLNQICLQSLLEGVGWRLLLKERRSADVHFCTSVPFEVKVFNVTRAIKLTLELRTSCRTRYRVHHTCTTCIWSQSATSSSPRLECFDVFFNIFCHPSSLSLLMACLKFVCHRYLHIFCLRVTNVFACIVVQ